MTQPVENQKNIKAKFQRMLKNKEEDKEKEMKALSDEFSQIFEQYKEWVMLSFVMCEKQRWRKPSTTVENIEIPVCECNFSDRED